MTENTDVLKIEVLGVGIEKVSAQLTELEKKSIRLTKSLNTALSGGNKGTAKGFRTQLRDVSVEKRELNLRKKMLAEEQAAIIKQENAKANAIKTTEKNMMDLNRKSLQVGLSFMFFGMAVQRAFQGIATSSLTTFNKLNADTAAANNSINRLAAGFQAIQYTVGDAISSALGPLEDILQNIIQWVIDFINEHQELTAWVIIVGLLAGAFMAVWGMVKLFSIGLALLPGLFTKAGAAGTASGESTTSAWSGALWKILGIIVVFFALFKLLNNDPTAVNWAKKFITAIAGVIAYIMLLSTRLIQTLASMLNVLGIKTEWVFESLGVILQNTFADIINWIIDGINKLIAGWNKIASSSIGKFLGLKKISPLQGRMEKWSQDTVDERRDRNLKAEQERLAYYYSDEYAKSWMDQAKTVGEDFAAGMAKVSEWSGMQQFTNSATVQQEAANKQLESANLNAQILQEQKQLFENLGNQSGSGNAFSSVNNGTLTFGYSTTSSGASN